MNIYNQVNELIRELRIMTNYIDTHSNRGNLRNECNEDFNPLRINDISKSFNIIKTDIETQSKRGIPDELQKIRDTSTKLAVETSELYDSIMNGFNVEIKKINDRIIFILNHL